MRWSHQREHYMNTSRPTEQQRHLPNVYSSIWNCHRATRLSNKSTINGAPLQRINVFTLICRWTKRRGWEAQRQYPRLTTTIERIVIWKLSLELKIKYDVDSLLIGKGWHCHRPLCDNICAEKPLKIKYENRKKCSPSRQDNMNEKIF